jgi:hypothetical protein
MDEILNGLLPVGKRIRRRGRSNDQAEGKSDVFDGNSQKSGTYATDFATDA